MGCVRCDARAVGARGAVAGCASGVMRVRWGCAWLGVRRVRDGACEGRVVEFGGVCGCGGGRKVLFFYDIW